MDADEIMRKKRIGNLKNTTDDWKSNNLRRDKKKT